MQIAPPVDRGSALDLRAADTRHPRWLQVGPAATRGQPELDAVRVAGAGGAGRAGDRGAGVQGVLGAQDGGACTCRAGVGAVLRTAQGVDDVFEAATRASMLMREGVPAHAGGHQHNRLGGSMGHRRNSSGEGWEEKGRCCVIC